MAENVQDEQINQDDNNDNNQVNWLETQPEDVKDYIQKLRKENANNRVKRNEVDTRYQEAIKKADELDKLREEAAKKNGEFEKLYLDEKEKASKVTDLQERILAYENTFLDQFEAAKKDLSTVQLELIEESAMSIEKKLQWANKLKSENKVNIESPSSERPGGSPISSDTALKNYKEADMEQRSTILFETKKSNPKLYNQLLSL